MSTISTRRAAYTDLSHITLHKVKQKPVCPLQTRDTLNAIIADAKLAMQATTENVYQLRLSRLRSRLKQL